VIFFYTYKYSTDFSGCIFCAGLCVCVCVCTIIFIFFIYLFFFLVLLLVCMPRQISWCFFPSLCPLLINTWSLSLWSDVQFHQLSTLRFQYSALHKQSHSIYVCNNFKRKYGRKNCPILLIDCFCHGTPRLISAYRI